MTYSILTPHARMRIPPRRRALLLFLNLKQWRRPIFECTVYYRRFTDFFEIEPIESD